MIIISGFHCIWFCEPVTVDANGARVIRDVFHLSWIWMETDHRRLVTSRGDCKQLCMLYIKWEGWTWWRYEAVTLCSHNQRHSALALHDLAWLCCFHKADIVFVWKTCYVLSSSCTIQIQNARDASPYVEYAARLAFHLFLRVIDATRSRRPSAV